MRFEKKKEKKVTSSGTVGNKNDVILEETKKSEPENIMFGKHYFLLLGNLILKMFLT